MNKKNKCKVIGISAIKGGVGKTSVTVNLGAILASEFHKHVLIIDMNLTAPNLGIHFGFIDMDATIHHVLDKKKNPNDAIYEYTQKLHVIPGILKGKFSKKWNIKKVIDKLRKNYDYILLDTSPNLDEISFLLGTVDEFITITTPDFPTLNTTMQLDNLLKNKMPIKGIIINCVRNKKFELTKEDIESTTRIPVIGVLPYDLKVHQSIAELTPLYFYKPHRKIVRQLKHISNLLLDKDDPERLTESGFNPFKFWKQR